MFSLAENVFLNEFFIPYGGGKFLYCGNYFFLYNYLLLVETCTEISGNKFFWGKTAEKDLPPSENCFLSFRGSFLQVETVTETSSLYFL